MQWWHLRAFSFKEHRKPSTDQFGRQKLQQKPLADQNALTTARRQLTTFRKLFYDCWQPTAEQRVSEVVKRSATGIYVYIMWPCQYWKYGIDMHMQVHTYSYCSKKTLVNVAVYLKQVGIYSANGRQLLDDWLKNRKTYRPVWPAKRFLMQLQKPPKSITTSDNLLPTSKNLSTTSDRVIEMSATGLYLCVTGTLMILKWK